MINEPESLGTSAKQALRLSNMSKEKALAFPSSNLIIETSPFFVNVAKSAIFSPKFIQDHMPQVASNENLSLPTSHCNQLDL